MKVTFDVDMTDEAMTSFVYYHNYSRFSGWLGVILGVVSAVLAIATFGETSQTFTIMYNVFAFLFLVWTPLNLRSKAKLQRRNTPMFQKTITYTLDDDGITTAQDDQRSQVKWDELLKVVVTKKIIIFYVTRVKAFIAPRECVGEQYDAVMEVLRAHIDAKKIKARG